MNRSMLIIISFLLFPIFTFAQTNSLLELETLCGQAEINYSKDIASLPQSNPDGGGGIITLGSWLVGVSGDISFPFGEDFKNFAGTGYSGHLSVGYFFLNNFLVSLSVGYVKFGEKTQSFDEVLTKIAQGNEITQNFSQIPILIGGEFYPDLGPDCMGMSCLSGGLFKPFIGLDFGYYAQKYTYKSMYSYGEFSETYEESDSEGKFGFAPKIGGIYKVGKNINLKAGISYNYIFHEAEEGGSNINYLSLNFGATYNLR